MAMELDEAKYEIIKLRQVVRYLTEVDFDALGKAFKDAKHECPELETMYYGMGNIHEMAYDAKLLEILAPVKDVVMKAKAERDAIGPQMHQGAPGALT